MLTKAQDIVHIVGRFTYIWWLVGQNEIRRQHAIFRHESQFRRFGVPSSPDLLGIPYFQQKRINLKQKKLLF